MLLESQGPPGMFFCTRYILCGVQKFDFFLQWRLSFLFFVVFIRFFFFLVHVQVSFKQRLNVTLGSGDQQQVGKCLVTNLSKIVADHHAHGSSVFAFVLLTAEIQHWPPFLFDIKWGIQQIKPVLYSTEMGIVHACCVAAKSQHKTLNFPFSSSSFYKPISLFWYCLPTYFISMEGSNIQSGISSTVQIDHWI